MSDGLIVMDDTLLKRTKMNEDTYDACGQLNYDTGGFHLEQRAIVYLRASAKSELAFLRERMM